MRVIENIGKEVAEAVAFYWNTRKAQKGKQIEGGKSDAGLRSAVTGGAHVDGFVSVFGEIVEQAGIPAECIFRKKSLELPGFFRPTKEWDLLVIKNKMFILVLVLFSSNAV